MALSWGDKTERLTDGRDIALVLVTGRQHVSVYRPTFGQWRLVVLAPLHMPGELMLELVSVHLTPDEMGELEKELSKHWP